MKKLNVASSSVSERQVHSATEGGVHVLLTRVRRKPCAFSAKCPHVGLSLARGKIVDGTIHCPWHGSRFDCASGENLDWAHSFAGVPMPKWTHCMLALGKQPAPLKMFDAVEEDGVIVVTLPDA